MAEDRDVHGGDAGEEARLRLVDQFEDGADVPRVRIQDHLTPFTMERSMTAVSPYTWKRGIAPRTRSGPCAPVTNHAAHWAAFATRFRWVSIAPFGVPVVPPVYCRTATLSGFAGVCTESVGVFARSANRWIHGSCGIERGQWPAFWRSFFLLIGYSCRSGVLRNSAASQTTTLWTWVPAFALETLCQNRSRATTVSTPASFHRTSSSRGVRIGFVWTTIAPVRRTAKKATMKWGVFGRRRDTRSPARTPIDRRPAANRLTAASRSRYVNVFP